MLNVAHVVEAFEGGVLTYLRTVLPGLVRGGCGVTLIASLERGWPGATQTLSQLANDGVAIRLCPMRREVRPVADWAAVAEVRNILRSGEFDVVHTHASKAGAVGRIAARLAGVRVGVHTPHCFAFCRCEDKWKGRVYLNVERMLGRMTTRLLAVSGSEAQTAVDRGVVPADRCTWLPNPLGLAQEDVSGQRRREIKRELRLEEGSPVVLTVCRLARGKGVFRFLEASLLCRADAVFVIAGDGELAPEVARYIVERGLSGKVRMLGHVGAMGEVYSIADVVVLCSKAEGLPYALLEAMQARRAIVATAVAGNSDLIEDGCTGMLVAQDGAVIAGAIDSLVSSPKMRERLGGEARARLERNHSVNGYVMNLMNLYRRCLEETA